MIIADMYTSFGAVKNDHFFLLFSGSQLATSSKLQRARFSLAHRRLKAFNKNSVNCVHSTFYIIKNWIIV